MAEVQTITQAISNANLALEALAQGTLAQSTLIELTNSPTKLRGFIAAYATFNGILNNEQEACLCKVLTHQAQAQEVGILLVKNCIMAGISALAHRARADKEQEANSLAVLAKIEQLAARLALKETAQAKAEALEAIGSQTTNGTASNPWKSFFERWGYSEKQLLEIVPYIEKL
jgi:hypothetical protein